MKRTLAFAGLVLGATLAVHAGAGPANPVGQGPGGALAPAESLAQRTPSEYRRLVEAVKRGDAGVDFVRLRASWAADPCVSTRTPDRSALVVALAARNWVKAAELAPRVLEDEFVNPDLHLATAEAYKALKQADSQQFHESVADKLLRAMLTTGDGTTTATAYRVYSIREAFLIMRELGYPAPRQSFVATPQGRVDVLTGENEDKKIVSVFFNIDRAAGNRPPGVCIG